MLEKMQVWLAIPKFLEAILCLFIILHLNRKYKDIKFFKRPQIHVFLVSGITAWFIYMMLDVVIYIIAPLSISATDTSLIVSGYNSGYFSLTLANILRDIGMFSAILLSWIYLLTALSIKFGERQVTEKILKNPFIIISIILFSVILTSYDLIVIKLNSGNLKVNANWTGSSMYFMFLIIGLFGVSAIVLGTQLRSIIKTEDNLLIRKKIYFIMFGVIFMALGNIYWLIFGGLSHYIVIQLFFSNIIYYSIAHIMGHCIWMLSPLLIYRGLLLEL